ncbi:SAM-dependent methyltransferase [Leptospira sp. GIMC2001]|uniref:SAM-dependent methyltransferase n=1 Tax=Leptospira sp. GIMC2001 TaxID=1513297 RepID=UPI00234927C5|nr:methyltransferase domain-containing protein [Leptospira sp. GIMC2001]WCL49192.1 methyltransferase domain-containing protein [Leptospira sp. GIMC2001]
MSSQASSIDKAKNYYNSSDADEFYFHVWGGEDIHIGLYDPPGIPIRQASRNTVSKMAKLVEANLKPASKVLDLGAGYGGAARYLAKTYGCHVTCLNLSEVENDRNRDMSQKAGLSELITVIDGNFENLPFEDSSFDVIWSEDAILHSGNKPKVFQEVSRVLSQKGDFVFTDPMQSQNCPEGVLQPIYDRIHLDSLGSFDYYGELAKESGMTQSATLDYSIYLPIHYQSVRDNLVVNRNKLLKNISEEFLNRMITGLGHWIDGGNKGYLAWGILHFRKS